MNDFVLLCKSYRGDVRRVKRLLDSLAPHNPEQLPVVIVVPQADQTLCFRIDLPIVRLSPGKDLPVPRNASAWIKRSLA